MRFMPLQGGIKPSGFGALVYVPAERGGRYERARVDATRWGRFCGGSSKEIMKWKFRDFVSAKTAE